MGLMFGNPTLYKCLSSPGTSLQVLLKTRAGLIMLFHSYCRRPSRISLKTIRNSQSDQTRTWLFPIPVSFWISRMKTDKEYRRSLRVTYGHWLHRVTNKPLISFQGQPDPQQSKVLNSTNDEPRVRTCHASVFFLHGHANHGANWVQLEYACPRMVPVLCSICSMVSPSSSSMCSGNLRNSLGDFRGIVCVHPYLRTWGTECVG